MKKGEPPCEYHEHHCDACHERKICTKDACVAERGNLIRIVPLDSSAGRCLGVQHEDRRLMLNYFREEDEHEADGILTIPTGARRLIIEVRTTERRHKLAVRGISPQPKQEGEVFAMANLGKWHDYDLLVRPPPKHYGYAATTQEYDLSELGMTGGQLMQLAVSPQAITVIVEFA